MFMKTLDYVVRCRLVASHRQVADAGKALRPRSLRPESSIDNLPRLQLTVVAGAQTSELSMQQRAAVPSAPGAGLRVVGSVLRELQLHRRKEVVDLPELTICRSHTNNQGALSESLARM